MKTSIAVVGPPQANDLVALLRDTGAPLVTTATDPALVRQAVAQLDAKHVALVWLVDPADGLARTWVELQAGRGSSVLAIAEPGTEIGFTTRLLPLSATANDLLAAFGKPGLPSPAGDAPIGVETAPQASDLHEDDDWAMPAAPAEPATEPARSAVATADLTFLDLLSEDGPEQKNYPAINNRGRQAEPQGRQTDPNQPEGVNRGRQTEPLGRQTDPNQPEGVNRGRQTEPLGRQTDPNQPEGVNRGRQTDPLGRQTDPNQPEGVNRGRQTDPSKLNSSPPASTGDDDYDFVAASSPDRIGRQIGEPVIVVMAGKGGVGKTTLSILLAQRAARIGSGMKVVLVDGNLGQPDATKFLRLREADTPSMLDMAMGRSALDVVISPRRLASLRPSGMEMPLFGVVLAPHDGSDPNVDQSVVTPGHYADLVARLRKHDGVDLVIVDTQIMESVDSSGMVTDFVIPILADQSRSALAVAVSDLTLPSGRNLMARVRDLVLRCVPSGRIRVVLNGAKDTSAANAAKMLDSISTGFQSAGIIDNDDRIANGMALGSFPHDTPSLARVLDGLLYAATGQSEFDPEQHPDRYVVAGRNGGLFGWLRRAR